MRARDPLVAVRLPADMLAALDEAVRLRPRGRKAWEGAASRSAVVREALEAFLHVDRWGQPVRDRDLPPG